MLLYLCKGVVNAFYCAWVILDCSASDAHLCTNGSPGNIVYVELIFLKYASRAYLRMFTIDNYVELCFL